MLERLGNLWWGFLLKGVLALLFAIAAVIWPGITLSVLIALFGAYLLVDGVVSLITSFRNEGWGWYVLQGLASLGAGLVTFIWPGLTALSLLFLIGGWAIVKGIGDIVAAIRIRKEVEGEWVLVVAGIASIAFGLLVILRPGAGALGVLWVIAFFAFLLGILFITLGLKLRKVTRGVEARLAGTA
jgi:uncharacterized membrane protein HdeD (DUF308 family)